MSGVGELLRSHRTSQGVALEQIAEVTRISVHQLEAIEEERLDELPGGVFRVSFVRQFARCVGADEEEAVRLLKSQTTTAVELSNWDSDPQRRDPYLNGGRPVARLMQMAGGFLREHGSALASVAVGLLLIIGGLYSYQSWEVKKQQDAEQAEAIAQAAIGAEPEAAPISQPTLEPAVQSASLDAPEQEPASPISLRLQIVERVWILAVADGEQVLEGIYQPGRELEPIEAEKAVELKVGNAGGVSLAFNGKDFGLIGPAGRVRNIVVTPEGVEVIGPTPRGRRPSQESVRVPTTTASLRWAELAFSTPAVR